MSWNHVRLDARRWAKVKRAAHDRDGWRCTRCHLAGRPEAHHVQPLEKGGAPFDLSNVETLCRSCHIEHHKSEADDTPGRADWRAFVKAIAET